MKLIRWEELPKDMQNDAVRKYYDILSEKSSALFVKRTFDLLCASFLLLLLSPMLLLLAIAIKLDTPGTVFFRQERVTQYGRRFRIHKLRTMVSNADRQGSLVTVKDDRRITRVGKLIRRYRLDELAQLIDVLLGDMSFVGTRPEVVKYVERYTPEMMATLLLPAGITSEASIHYMDEDRLLADSDNIDDTYVNKVLPGKMVYNLSSIENFGIRSELQTMLKTIAAVFGHRYK